MRQQLYCLLQLGAGQALQRLGHQRAAVLPDLVLIEQRAQRRGSHAALQRQQQQQFALQGAQQDHRLHVFLLQLLQNMPGALALAGQQGVQPVERREVGGVVHRLFDARQRELAVRVQQR